MKLFLRLLLGLFFSLSFSSCAENIQSVVSGQACLDLVQKQIDFGPRVVNSEAARLTAEWIVAEAKKVGWEARIDEWTEGDGKSKKTFRNVICTLDGEAEGFVIVGSHYDTKTIPGMPDFTGANDGASSTALLIHMMPLFKAKGSSLRFVFFDGEECEHQYSDKDGLHGSRRYASQLVVKQEVGQCRAMILADLIGDKNLNVEIPANGDALLANRLMEFAKVAKVDKYFSLGKTAVLDDHAPFVKLGIPAIDIIDFDFGPGNSYWHTEEDTIDKLSAKSFAIVGQVMYDLIEDVRQ